MLGFELSDEQKELKALARHFAEQEIIPRARQYDEEATFPRRRLRKSVRRGSDQFRRAQGTGRSGMGVLDVCLLSEELNYGCSGIANAIAANDLGVLPLLIAGSEEQKRTYLGQLMKSLTFCAFAITEPGAGSDVAAMAASYRARATAS